MRVVSDVSFMLGLVLLMAGATAWVIGSGHFDVLRRSRRYGAQRQGDGAATEPRESGRRGQRRGLWALWAGSGLVAIALLASAFPRA